MVRKATGQEDDEIILQEESKVNLARNLIKLADILQDVEADLYPNKICDYLFETSQKFNQFYENCAVNNAETPELKASRLTLCAVTAATIRLLLGMLGIKVVERQTMRKSEGASYRFSVKSTTKLE
jgi:arginyl-tRNA synthetase